MPDVEASTSSINAPVQVMTSEPSSSAVTLELLDKLDLNKHQGSQDSSAVAPSSNGVSSARHQPPTVMLGSPSKGIQPNSSKARIKSPLLHAATSSPNRSATLLDEGSLSNGGGRKASVSLQLFSRTSAGYGGEADVMPLNGQDPENRGRPHTYKSPRQSSIRVPQLPSASPTSRQKRKSSKPSSSCNSPSGLSRSRPESPLLFDGIQSHHQLPDLTLPAPALAPSSQNSSSQHERSISAPGPRLERSETMTPQRSSSRLSHLADDLLSDLPTVQPVSAGPRLAGISLSALPQISATISPSVPLRRKSFKIVTTSRPNGDSDSGSNASSVEDDHATSASSRSQATTPGALLSPPISTTGILSPPHRHVPSRQQSGFPLFSQAASPDITPSANRLAPASDSLAVSSLTSSTMTTDPSDAEESYSASSSVFSTDQSEDEDAEEYEFVDPPDKDKEAHYDYELDVGSLPLPSKHRPPKTIPPE